MVQPPPRGLLRHLLLIAAYLSAAANFIPDRCSVSTLAGTTASDQSVDGAPLAGASFSFPSSIVQSPRGGATFLITDSGAGLSRPTLGNRVRELAPARASTLAGTGARAPFANGPALSATLARPMGLAVDAAGNIFIADLANRRVRYYSEATGELSTLAGSGVNSAIDGLGTAASFNQPFGVCYNPDRAVVEVLEYTFSVVRSVSVAPGAAWGNTTLVAGALDQLGFLDGVGGAARFNGPTSCAYSSLLPGGGYVIADQYNHAVRAMRYAAGGAALVVTLAGTSGFAGFVDGDRDAVRFRFPSGVAFDESSNVTGYSLGVVVVDQNHALRYVSLATGDTVTLAGTGAPGAADGAGSSASFNFSQGVVRNALPDRERAGSVQYLVADTLNGLIRAVDCVLAQPSPSATPSPSASPFSSPARASPSPSRGSSASPSPAATAPAAPAAAAAAADYSTAGIIAGASFGALIAVIGIVAAGVFFSPCARRTIVTSWPLSATPLAKYIAEQWDDEDDDDDDDGDSDEEGEEDEEAGGAAAAGERSGARGSVNPLAFGRRNGSAPLGSPGLSLQLATYWPPSAALAEAAQPPPPAAPAAVVTGSGGSGSEGYMWRPPPLPSEVTL